MTRTSLQRYNVVDFGDVFFVQIFFADGKPACGRTIILTDSATKRNRK